MDSSSDQLSLSERFGNNVLLHEGKKEEASIVPVEKKNRGGKKIIKKRRRKKVAGEDGIKAREEREQAREYERSGFHSGDSTRTKKNFFCCILSLALTTTASRDDARGRME
jgi:hypothetical protein